MDKDALRKAVEAHELCQMNPITMPCDRCAGKGYHHGFGEGGHDPDWCESCGGAGYQLADDEDARTMQAAITAYLEAVGGVVVPREPTGEMVIAGHRALHELNRQREERGFTKNQIPIAAYRAMITASQEGQGQ